MLWRRRFMYWFQKLMSRPASTLIVALFFFSGVQLFFLEYSW